MMKFLKALLWLLLFLLTLVLLFVGWISYTNSGLNFGLELAQKFTDNQLSYSDAKGTLAQGFEINQLSFDSDDFSFSATKLDAQLSLLDLVSKTLTLEKLNAQTVTVFISPATDTSNKQTQDDFQLPLGLNLKNIHIENIQYKMPDMNINLQQLTGKLQAKPQGEVITLNSQLSFLKGHYSADNHKVSLQKTQLKLSGNTKDYQGFLKSQVTYDTYPDISSDFSFQGSDNAIHFTNLNLNSDWANITGKLSLFFAPTFGWKADVTATQNQPQSLQNTNLNHIKFALQTTGEKTPSGFKGQLELNNLQGNINKHAFSGAIHLVFTPDTFEFTRSYFKMQQNQLDISGGFSQVWDLNWRLNIPSLATFFQLGYGKIYSTGKINGSTTSPSIEGQLKASQLEVLGVKANNINFNIDYQPQKPARAHLNATGISYNSTVLNSVDLNLTGSLSHNQLQLKVTSPQLNVSSQLAGKYSQKSWQGNINQLYLQSPVVGSWHLEKATALNLSFQHNHFTSALKSLCLKNNTQSFCLSLDKSIQKLKITTAIQNLRLTDILAMIAPDNAKAFESSSRLNLKLSLSNGSNPKGFINGYITPGYLQVHSGDHVQKFELKSSSIKGILSQNKLNISTYVNLSNQQFLKGNVSIENFLDQNKTQTLSGKVSINYHDFDILTKLIPGIETAKGYLTANLNLAGTMTKPQMTGDITLKNAYITLPDYGLTLTGINLRGKTDAEGKLNLTAQVASGGGQMTVKGWINPLADNLPFNLDIAGKDFLVYKTDEYTFYLSPDINVEKKDKAIKVTGKVLIPKAIISPTDFSSGSVALPDDASFVSDEQKATPYLIMGNIQLIAGDNIYLNVKGLTGNVQGQVNVNYNSQTSSTATGTLSISNGKFSAYGQNLTISTGKVIYNASPLDNPGISVEASKTISNDSAPSASNLGSSFTFPASNNQQGVIKVGVKVQGTVNNYKVSLFSNPAIYSQSDILSLILTGETADNLSGNNAQLVLKAASALNLGGNSVGNITQELKKSFGLDELGVTQESVYSDGNTTQTTAFTLGKKLTPKLFISYSIGILDPISIFKASYLLSKSWRVQATASSEDTGADIFYTIEK